MEEKQKKNNEELAETLSQKYTYKDLKQMQENGEGLSVSSKDIQNANDNKLVITKDTPNPYGKRILFCFIALLAITAISILLIYLGKTQIAKYTSSIGIGYFSIDLANHIINYFRFNKLKKASENNKDN